MLKCSQRAVSSFSYFLLLATCLGIAGCRVSFHQLCLLSDVYSDAVAEWPRSCNKRCVFKDVMLRLLSKCQCAISTGSTIHVSIRRINCGADLWDCYDSFGSEFFFAVAPLCALRQLIRSTLLLAIAAQAVSSGCKPRTGNCWCA